MPRRRLPLLAAALALTAVAAGACTNANGTGGKQFVTSDGVVIEIPVGERGEPVSFQGESLAGEAIDLVELRGHVVVANVWGSWCTFCRAEAPMLVDAADELPAGTSMLGVDIRDASKDNALAFERSFGVPYPSIFDPGSESLLEFPPPFNPREIPSTMVLDAQGRMAALVRGPLPSKLTLVDLVEKVAGEDGSEDGAGDG